MTNLTDGARHMNDGSIEQAYPGVSREMQQRIESDFMTKVAGFLSYKCEGLGSEEQLALIKKTIGMEK